jgi:hypothetical protein
MTARVIFQYSMSTPMPTLRMTSQLASLSSRYRRMTVWQKAFRNSVRTERPSIDFLFLQKLMSGREVIDTHYNILT